jgi:hypothetical protein
MGTTLKYAIAVIGVFVVVAVLLLWRSQVVSPVGTANPVLPTPGTVPGTVDGQAACQWWLPTNATTVESCPEHCKDDRFTGIPGNGGEFGDQRLWVCCVPGLTAVKQNDAWICKK